MGQRQMKFAVDRDFFLGVLKCVDGVCPPKGSFVSLACCHIEARADTVIVTGTDLELTLRIIEQATVLEEGKAIIPSHQLLEIVQSQPSGAQILIATEGSLTHITAGNFKARLSSMDIFEYPQLQNLEAESCLKISALELKNLINKTKFCISKDETRQEFTGVSMRVSQNGRVQMASTDGHRLSRVETAAEIQGTLNPRFEKGIILPQKALNEFSKVITDNGDIEFGIEPSGKKVTVRMGNMTYYATRIEGEFPDFSKVIPSQLEHKAIIKRDLFMQILTRAAIFTSKSLNTIKLTLSNGKVEVAAYDQARGEMADYIDADYEGCGVVAGFNHSYILDILKVIESDYISFEIIDTDSPVVIRDVTTNRYDFIVMPMQF